MSAPRNDEALREQGDEAEQKQFNPNDTSTANQRQIILAALRAGPKDTVTLRGEYGVLMPAPRIHELKNRYGHRIDRVNIMRYTEDGVRHSRVALYILRPTSDLFSEPTP